MKPILQYNLIEILLGHVLPKQCAGLAFVVIFYLVTFTFFASALFFFFAAIELLDIKIEQTRLERLITVLMVSLIDTIATGILFWMLRLNCLG